MEIPQNIIDEFYKGREHLELTIGFLKDGKIETVHYRPDRSVSDEELVYPAGSIGKPFTASLLAKLIAEGKADLDAGLDTYIPGLPAGYYPSLKRLATHHSGYGNAPYTTMQVLRMFMRMNREDGIMHVNPYRGIPDEAKMLEVLKTKKLKEKKEKFFYCNFAYGVLGYIVGKLCGSDYFTAMEDYFKELGLENASLSNSQMTGYDKKGNPAKPWQWERGDIVAPAGAMLSTMSDLLKFARIHMDGSHPYLDLTHLKHADGEKDFDQGLAWRIRKGSGYLYHAGNAGAFSCILAMNPKNNTAVAIGMNYALVEQEKAAFALLDLMK